MVSKPRLLPFLRACVGLSFPHSRNQVILQRTDGDTHSSSPDTEGHQSHYLMGKGHTHLLPANGSGLTGNHLFLFGYHFCMQTL